MLDQRCGEKQNLRVSLFGRITRLSQQVPFGVVKRQADAPRATPPSCNSRQFIEEPMR